MVDKVRENIDKLIDRLAELALEEKSWQFRNEKENFVALMALLFLGTTKSSVTVDTLDKIKNFEFVYDNLIGLIPDLIASQGMEAIERLKSSIIDTKKSDDYCSAILTGTMVYYLEKATDSEKAGIEQILQEALNNHNALEKASYLSYDICCSSLITGNKQLADSVRKLIVKWGDDFSLSERDFVSLYEYKQMMPHFVIHEYADPWEDFLKDTIKFRSSMEEGTLLYGKVKKLITQEESEKKFSALSNEVLARDIVLLNHQISRPEINEILKRGKDMLPLLKEIALDTTYNNKDDHGKAYGAVFALRFIGMMKDPETIPIICEILKKRALNAFLGYDGSLILAQFGETSLPHIKSMLINRQLAGRLRAYLQDSLIRMTYLFEEMDNAVEEVFSEYFSMISKKPDDMFVMIKTFCIIDLFENEKLNRKAKNLYTKFFGDNNFEKYKKKMLDSDVYTAENMSQGPEFLFSDEEILSLVHSDEIGDRGYLKDEIDQSTDEGQPVETFVREEPKTGRNDPCPCGSGKKFKKCCGK
jgi:hypothetical protein